MKTPQDVQYRSRCKMYITAIATGCNITDMYITAGCVSPQDVYHRRMCITAGQIMRLIML
jgi:hypothetical protein